MTEMRLSLVLEARAQQAKAELGAAKAGLDGLKAAAGDLGAATAAVSGDIGRLMAATDALSDKTGLTTQETLAYGLALDGVRARFNPLFAVSRRYEQELIDIAAAEKLGAISAMEAAAARDRAAGMLTPMASGVRALGQQSGVAAVNVANLGFQMNDIVMMATMGQAPLALMMQQGTQVTQVFGQMRASGQAIGPAILGTLRGLISPMSLVTLAAIAGGAALIQWGMAALGAGEDAKSLEERLDDLAEALDRVDRWDFSDLFTGVEARAVRIRGEFERIVELVQTNQREALQAQLSDSIAGFGLIDALSSYESQRSVRSQIGAAPPEFSALGFDDPERAMQAAQILNQITGQTREEIARSVDLSIIWLKGSGLMTDELDEQLALMAERLGLEQAVREAIEANTAAAADASSEATRANEALLDAMGALVAFNAEAADAAAAQRAEDGARAAELLSGLQAQADLQLLVARFGADSAQVTAQRAAAERDAHVALVQSLTISSELKAELIQNYDWAQATATVPLPAMLASAAGAAGGLLSNLAAAASAAWDMAAGAAAAGGTGAVWRAANLALGDDERGSSQREGRLDVAQTRADEALRLANQRAGAYRNRGAAAPGGGSSPGGGAALQADPVADLLEQLDQEYALLIELDPVQQEMLRHREALAEATDAERLAIEEKVRRNIDEAAALELVQEQMAETRALGADLVGGIISDLREGASAGDILVGVLDRIADKLADLATEGFTDILFGTGENGAGAGLIGDFVRGLLFPGSAIKTKAASGAVIGSPTLFGLPGGGLGLMAEAGAEAIMPLTHQFGAGVGARLGGSETVLPLARLASGKLGVDLGAPSPFALGAAFGDLPTASAPASWRQAMGDAGPGQTAVIQLQPTLVNNTARPMDLQVEETTDARGQRQQRYILSDAVAEGLGTPGGRGGRTLQQAYGLRPAPRVRG